MDKKMILFFFPRIFSLHICSIFARLCGDRYDFFFASALYPFIPFIIPCWVDMIGIGLNDDTTGVQ